MMPLRCCCNPFLDNTIIYAFLLEIKCLWRAGKTYRSHGRDGDNTLQKKEIKTNTQYLSGLFPFRLKKTKSQSLHGREAFLSSATFWASSANSLQQLNETEAHGKISLWQPVATKSVVFTCTQALFIRRFRPKSM